MTFLNIYANLKYPLEDVMNIISDETMRELPIAKMWVEEGSLLTRRADIVRVLRSRHKITPTEEFAAALELIKDSDRLDHLFDVALSCATIDEFRAAL